jgi:hypothetical protein
MSPQHRYRVTMMCADCGARLDAEVHVSNFDREHVHQSHHGIALPNNWSFDGGHPQTLVCRPKTITFHYDDKE